MSDLQVGVIKAACVLTYSSLGFDSLYFSSGGDMGFPPLLPDVMTKLMSGGSSGGTGTRISGLRAFALGIGIDSLGAGGSANSASLL